MSQLIFAADESALDDAGRRVTEHGLPLVTGGPDRFHIPPEAIHGALGERVAIVVTRVGDGSADVDDKPAGG
jgi:hypothetical protein